VIEYLELCAKSRWANLLPNRLQEDAELGGSGAEGIQDNRPRPAFSRQTFLTHLINFIVADDQVCYDVYLVVQSINVIECRKFCDLLLLLRDNLQDKDIPHCTKLREVIIKAWETWFTKLKANLMVCSVMYIVDGHFN